MVIEGSKVIYESQFLKEREKEISNLYYIFIFILYSRARCYINL